MAVKSRCLTSIVPEIMLDFNKLNSQIDFNNIDADQLTKVISEHRNSFFNLVLIAASLLLAGVMFNDHRVKEQNLRVKMADIQDKLLALDAGDAAVRDLNKFKSLLPKKLNESDLITLISEYAKSNNIVITSLSPADSKDMGLYDAVDVNFNSASDNFKDMMLFLRKIENSDFPLTINSWSGHEEADGRITFTLEISAVNIHT